MNWLLLSLALLARQTIGSDVGINNTGLVPEGVPRKSHSSEHALATNSLTQHLENSLFRHQNLDDMPAVVAVSNLFTIIYFNQSLLFSILFSSRSP